MTNPKYLRIKEVKKLTGFSQSHIWDLIRNNKIINYLPSPKVRLIDYDSLIGYIENSKNDIK